MSRMSLFKKTVFTRFAGMLRNPQMRYETELYSVLLLIVLFLVLVNLSSIRVVAQLRGVFEGQIYDDLLKAARLSVTILSDSPELTSSTNDWKKFVNRSYADSIELTQIDLPDFVSIPSFSGRLSAREIETLNEGEPLSVAPDKRSLAPGYVVLFPFGTSDGRSFILRLYKRADRYGVIANVARFNVLFHISSLLAIITLGYLYLRVTLKPFQRMQHAAREAATAPPRNGVSVEQIVTTFQKMIDELKDKELILQDLYQRTQKRADRLEQFNEYILAGMASGLVSCNREEIVTHLNRSAQKLLGIGEQQAIGKHYREALVKTPEMTHLIEKTLKEGVSCSRCELEVDAGDGNEISLGVSTTLIRDELGRKVGITVIMTDLTEVKKLQRDIAYKEKMAALGETAAGLAHELRNSMTAVVGFGELIRKLSYDNPRMLQVADSISREGSATEQMLTRFLAFAQPTEFTMDRVNAVEIVSDVMEGLRGTAEVKGVVLKLSSPSDPIIILGDQVAVRQAVSNVLLNAIQASPECGQIAIDVGSVEPGALVLISISDNGPGIPEELRQKVFNPFFTTKNDGTGLGLCTVRKFVSGMNGRVELSPPDTKGLTVKILLPGAGAEVPEPEIC